LGTKAYPDTKTDVKGRYELILHVESLREFWGPVNPTNSIMARDLNRKLAAILEFSGTPTNIDLNLQTGITLSASAQNIQDVLLANATLELRFPSGACLTKLKDEPVRANSAGVFSVPGLPQGRDYYAWDVTAKGYGSANGRVEAKNTQSNHY